MSIRKGIACLLLTAAAGGMLTGCSPMERYTTSFLGAFDTASMRVGYADSQETFDGYAGRFEELLLEYQPTMLFVEHDAMFCQKIADKSIEL